MLLTVTNNTAAPLELGFPVGRTIASLASVTLGVSIRDMEHGEDIGDPAYKRLDLLAQKGDITLSIAADAQNTSILNAARASA